MPSVHRLQDGWSIVLAGAWNPAILNPNWIATEILKASQPVTVDISIGIGAEAREIRFTDHSVGLAVDSTKLRLYPLELTGEAMTATDTFAVTLLDVLTHTPVTAAGVNYRFLCAEEAPKIAALFAVGDDETLVGLGFKKQKVEISRQLSGTPEFGEPLLNLKFSLDADRGRVSIDFNFHYQVTGAANIRRKLAGAFVGLQSFASKVLNQYDALVEEHAE